MNLPTVFPELDKLLKKMKVSSIPIIDTIDIKLVRDGVIVPSPSDYIIVDGIPTVKDRKVVLHLQDAWNYQSRYGSYPKYHVVNCTTLQDMQRRGEYDRYHATRRSSGNFLVKLSSSDELSPYKLKLCRNCLGELEQMYGLGVFPKDPAKFPLADWLESFDYEFDYSSPEWQERSKACRERAHWRCAACSIDLKDDPYFLHAHHKWGTIFNDSEDLVALCIGCHAEQPGDGHQLLRNYPAYRKFMEKYGSRPRPVIRTHQHQVFQQQAGYLTEVTEEDIPL